MITITLSAAEAKRAANRLREFLASAGINLKQTHAYEALAQALGYANWKLSKHVWAHRNTKSESSPDPTALTGEVSSAPDVGAVESSTTPGPGTEAWLRRYIDSMRRGQPNYDEMTPELARASTFAPVDLGILQSLSFRAKGPRGEDIFDAVFEKRRAEFTVGPLTTDGKVALFKRGVRRNAEEEAVIRQRIVEGKRDPERQDLLARRIAGQQQGVIAGEIMSPALIAAAKEQLPRSIQLNQRLGKFLSLQFLHVDMQGWDVYGATI